MLLPKSKQDGKLSCSLNTAMYLFVFQLLEKANQMP